MSSRLRTRLRAGTGLSTPSLSLEFQTATGALDPRITFSRTSQATLVDSTGKLTYAPNNLLTNSEAFEASSWTKTEINVTSNVAIAPDGTTTADNCVPTAIATTHQISSAVIISASPCVMSVYAKGNGYNTIVILDRISASNGASFDLTTGVATNIGAGIGSAVAVGNGWYRCSVAATTTGMRIYIPSASSVFAGDGTSGVLLWGAQLEQVTYQTTPGTYNSTSPKNLLGYTQEFDNAAWTKSNAFVQTNVVTNSEAFDNASWTKGGINVSANATSAPNGTQTADTLTPDTGVTVHRAYMTAGLNATSGTFSCYVRANGYTKVGLRESQTTGAGAAFDLSNGTVMGAFNAGGSTVSNMAITDVGGGWYRISCTIAFAASTLMSFGVHVLNPSYAAGGDLQTPWAGNGTSGIFAWGAQLVQGSTAGDYQRTDAAAAAVQYVAPDGSRTADKVVENTASARHGVNQSATVVAGVYTASVYAKKGENDFLALAPGGSGQPNTFTWFNLATGAMGTNNNTSASMTDVGNGWYRCSITFTPIAGTLVPLVETSKANGSNVYTGDGTSGIYIWGAQLSNSASLDPYVYNPVAAPTSAAYYGPRFDYDPVTLANKGLLIEEQRTNLLTYSEQFDNAAWVKTGVTATANSIISPDGVTSADTVTASAGAGYHYIEQRPAATAGVTYTASMYVKAGTTRYIGFGDAGDAVWHSAYLDTTNGAIISPTNCTATATAVGNGWFRVTNTFTRTNAGSLQIYVGGSAATGTSGPQFTAAGTETCYAWGAQLEAGSFATSYIPTVASQVTRTADVALMQGANFSNWYNQNEGTFSAEWLQGGSDGVQDVISANDGTTSNLINLRNDASSTAGVTPGSLVVSGGTIQASLSGAAISAGSINKFIFAYAANDFAYSQNGATPLTDTSGTVPVVNQMNIGNRVNAVFTNGHIRRIGYYPTRLANAQLQSLTAQSTIPSLSLDFTTQVFNVG